MAKKAGIPLTTCDFDFTAPPQADPSQPDAYVCVADNGNVTVSVNVTIGPCDTLTAWISSDSQGSVSVSSSVTLQNTSGTSYSGSVSVGSFSDTAVGTPNRWVTVKADDDTTRIRGFRAVHPGSCSGSSGSLGVLAALADVFQEGRPAPVSVSAEFGSPPTSGGPRVEAAVLVYSGAPGFERCWCSQPIDHRSDGADPALWMLERTDARTWLLRLRRGTVDLVVYRHTAAAERDGSLPARLHVEDDGNGAGVEWPLTVTISPAP